MKVALALLLLGCIPPPFKAGASCSVGSTMVFFEDPSQKCWFAEQLVNDATQTMESQFANRESFEHIMSYTTILVHNGPLSCYWRNVGGCEYSDPLSEFNDIHVTNPGNILHEVFHAYGGRVLRDQPWDNANHVRWTGRGWFAASLSFFDRYNQHDSEPVDGGSP